MSSKSTVADVVIVGAGASGGIVGRRLAEAGFDVVCLEQGRWHDVSEFPGQYADWELASGRSWSADPNVRRSWADVPVEASSSDVVPLMFNAVGGSTILYAGDWPRFTPSDFRVRTLDGVADDWPLTYADLEVHYDRTDIEMGVSGFAGDPAYPEMNDPPVPALPIGDEGMTIARGHHRMGWHWWPGRSAILSAELNGRRPCVQWGACMQGCPEGAKASTDATHWLPAQKHGAQLVTGARVRRVVVGADGLARGVEYLDVDGREHFQAARVVVLAANAIGTARLLLMSAESGWPDGLANRSGLVGRRLMMHPFSVVTGIFPERFETWRGHVGVRITCMEFYETDESRGFVRGAKWSMAPSTGGPMNAAMPARAGDVNWGADHHLLVRERFGHMLSWGIFGEDLPDPDNRVELDDHLRDESGLPAPRVTYTMSENSRRLLAFNCDRATESLEASGAMRVDAAPELRESGWHLMGTARMGDDPDESVVDPWGRTHDIDNLYVVDGSVFVTSGGVNPTSTIAALASRFADRMIETRHDQRVPA